jgi:2-oxoglutarate dehydrogenase E1 component
LTEGFDVRISGQDVGVGLSLTVMLLKVEDSEEEVIVLNAIEKKRKFNVYNSLLSEYGVLGFDYGCVSKQIH